MVRDFPQFRVRLPPDLDEWLERQAKINHRTKNAEMTYRLEEARKSADATGQASQA